MPHRNPWAVGLVLAILGVSAATAADGRSSVRDRYREIFELWTGGARAHAAGRLADELAGDGAERRTLDRVARATARRLARESGPAGALPLLLLHDEACARHLEESRSGVVAALRLSADLLTIVESRADTSEERLLLAALRTSLAGRMTSAHLIEDGLEQARAALGTDSSNTAAILIVGAAAERLGDHADAVRWLESLVRVDPDHREARLRLSLNLLRIGKAVEGRLGLEALVAEGGEDWVATLARQELARALLDTGEVSSAREVHSAVRLEGPADSASAVQVAYLEERLGRRGGTARLANALSRASIAPAPPARRLYLRSPGSDLEALRRDLVRREAAWAGRSDEVPQDPRAARAE